MRFILYKKYYNINSAIRIRTATDGIGCNEEIVSRILGGNDKYVVQEIVRRYKAKYDVDLAALMKKETGKLN